jgi:hypothetical protein
MKSTTTTGNVQCGFVYAQGARPGGGVATAIAGYADRIFRFMDTLAAEQAAAAQPAGAAAGGVGVGGSAGGGVNTSRLMSAVHGQTYFIFDQVCVGGSHKGERERARARGEHTEAGRGEQRRRHRARVPPSPAPAP